MTAFEDMHAQLTGDIERISTVISALQERFDDNATKNKVDIAAEIRAQMALRLQIVKTLTGN